MNTEWETKLGWKDRKKRNRREKKVIEKMREERNRKIERKERERRWSGTKVEDPKKSNTKKFYGTVLNFVFQLN